jgi:hypothetical protein
MGNRPVITIEGRTIPAALPEKYDRWVEEA